MLKNITCPDITTSKQRSIKNKKVYIYSLNTEYINNNIDLIRYRDQNFKNYDDKIKERFGIETGKNEDIFNDD